jgi:hypothetical protein
MSAVFIGFGIRVAKRNDSRRDAKKMEESAQLYSATPNKKGGETVPRVTKED